VTVVDLKPGHLRTLREIARAGTIAAAADSLGYTPSAISQQMTALTKDVGHSLLEPEGRGVRLSDAGRVLVRHTDQVLNALEEARSAIEASFAKPAGELQVGVFESFATALLPGLLDALARSQPALRVCVQQMHPDEATHAVATGVLDAAFVPDFASKAGDRRLLRRHVCRDWFRIAVADDDPITGNAAPITELEGRDLIGEVYVFPACRQAGFEPTIRHHLHDYTAVLQLVASGNVVALVPDLALTSKPSGVRLVDPIPDMSRDIQIVTRHSSADRPAIEALTDLAVQMASRLGLDTTGASPIKTPSRSNP
jgi:DNA-binding transcriptional LysR family regulator